MKSDSKILVAGANGMVGSAIVRCLKEKGFNNIIVGTRELVDFTSQEETSFFIKHIRPEYVFLAAAKVGGILGNKNHPAEFIYDNLMIQCNVIDSAYRHGVKKLVFLGSSCIYPMEPKIPITEDQLLAGPLETSNDAYAIAKIAGMRMCRAYRQQYGFNAISLMPCNLYGPRDTFNTDNGHVLPSMMMKFHDALSHSEHWEVKLWGDGSPKREFLHVDDLANACYVAMQEYDGEHHLNVGTGEDISIKDLAEMVAESVGYDRDINWDTSKPNGTMRKVLNVDKIKSLGWYPHIKLKDGIDDTYSWFKNNVL
jgi:GDP-L-fucose synthase